MAHGFGISTDELMAIELSSTARMRGYGSTITGSTVTITHHSGYMVHVVARHDKYNIKVDGKSITNINRRYKHISSVMKAVDKAFDIIIDKRNKRY